MISKRIFLFICLMVCLQTFSYANILSDSAKISLITIAPGDDLYSSFGHSAFWIYDPQTGFDRVYNYGTFDFDEPNFYLKFIRGKLLYKLSLSNMDNLLYGAQREGRSVTEQVLNLDPTTKDRLFKFLENNYLPENRYYKYDFFFDNCSTRERDALIKVLGNSLQFHFKATEERSFRQLLDPYLVNKQWQDLGMDTGLGTPADKIATAFDYMYLPDFLMENFASATIQKADKEVPLVSKTNYIYQGHVEQQGNSFLSPTVLFWVFFAIILLLTILQFKRNSSSRKVDSFLLIFTGLLGLLLLFLWFGTDHYVTKNNWNLIWANPINLVAVVFLLRRSQLEFQEVYFLLYGILTLLLLIFWSIIPQEINGATFPFILILSTRAFYLYFQGKKLIKKSSL